MGAGSHRYAPTPRAREDVEARNVTILTSYVQMQRSECRRWSLGEDVRQFEWQGCSIQPLAGRRVCNVPTLRVRLLAGQMR
jgi:hypothetical protein